MGFDINTSDTIASFAVYLFHYHVPEKKNTTGFFKNHWIPLKIFGGQKQKPVMLCGKRLSYYTLLSWEKAPSVVNSEDVHVSNQILTWHESEIKKLYIQGWES